MTQHMCCVVLCVGGQEIDTKYDRRHASRTIVVMMMMMVITLMVASHTHTDTPSIHPSIHPSSECRHTSHGTNWLPAYLPGDGKITHTPRQKRAVLSVSAHVMVCMLCGGRPAGRPASQPCPTAILCHASKPQK
mmetsp:Transcript_48597/g.121662  ORF Transcript_48597/g.121662 Transcript_48597/m.121662 type:complete len:134 (-) Transcript_48597:365-766(-)